MNKETKNIKNIDGRFVGITKISSELIENLKLIYKKNFYITKYSFYIK